MSSIYQNKRYCCEARLICMQRCNFTGPIVRAPSTSNFNDIKSVYIYTDSRRRRLQLWSFQFNYYTETVNMNDWTFRSDYNDLSPENFEFLESQAGYSKFAPTALWAPGTVPAHVNRPTLVTSVSSLLARGAWRLS